jgi:serine/threonine protein kinase/tetratricopeptide (TPR) repeat protein
MVRESNALKDYLLVKERELFITALHIEDPARRSAYLDQECGSDAELRQRVEALLRAFAQAGSFLQQPAPEAMAPIDVSPADLLQNGAEAERPGTVIGPYRLVQQIGEGGMGIVFLAEQTQPVQRRVALKVIKPGMDSQQIIARFEAERQALALMDHVNIARVLDAGTTESGRPYFVMELVHGAPLTQYCDEQRLTPRERLELFVPVCQAIQHAHQKGIIHRDIKPSNVMITLYDGKPVPKVIDFGLAKAMEQKLTERTLFTQYGTMVGTLEYVSPEQAETSALGVDTRSDIYSLGVLLYELLTGTTPLNRKRITEVPYAEIIRLIKEQEPPRPSSRLSDSGDALASISAQRKMEPARLTKLVRGELDWIVMKTLEKDRNRRYETANALALDVQRYLTDEPVEACPPSALYRFGKFARRNKVTLAAASAIGLAAVIMVVVLAIDNAVIARQKQAKEQALEQKETALVQARLEKERADQNLGKADEAVEHYLFRTAEDPRLKSADLHELRKDLLVSAIPYYEAFTKQKGVGDQLEAKQGAAYYALAYLRAEMGERKQALADYERAETIFAHQSADAPARARYRQLLGYCHNALGNEFRDLGKPTEAEQSYGKALAIQEKLANEFPASPYYRLELAGTHNNLGMLFRQQGDVVQAEAHHSKALALRKQLADAFPRLPQCRRDLARSHANLGVLRMGQGKYREAEAHYRQALELQKKLVTEFPGVPDYGYDLGASHFNLGVLMSGLRNPGAALGQYRQGIELHKKLTEDFPRVPEYRHALATSQTGLARLLRALGEPAEAETVFRQALAIETKLAQAFPNVPAYRSELARIQSSLGLLLRVQGRWVDAEESFRQALSLQEKLTAESLSPQSECELGGILNNLAMLRMDQGKLAEAARLLRQAVAHQKAALRSYPRHPTYRQFLRNHYAHLAETLVRLGEHREAARVAEELSEVSGNPADSYDAACYLARCVPMAEKDAARALGNSKELAQSYADRAVQLLGEAIQRGWKDANRIRKDSALGPLRQRADFQKLLADLQEKTRE